MRMALALGDYGGIGPELAAALLTGSDFAGTDLVLIGDARQLAAGAALRGKAEAPPVLDADAVVAGGLTHGTVMIDLSNGDPASVPQGRSTPEAGAASLQNFAAALRLAQASLADAVMFTPFNKHSMRLARPGYVDEIGFINATLDATRSGREFNVLDEVWNARVTSHVPLSAVAGLITTDRVLASLRLTHEVMEAAGKPAPRIGVAALNPHAGDGRNFGDEDEDAIRPAVEQARADGISADGPIPSDTVFLRATRGEFDAVLTMYHDQGQIAMKLIGFDRGVTLIAGYDFPIVTPAHGSAFDIAGKGRADPGATREAARLGIALAALNPAKRQPLPLAAGWHSAPVPGGTAAAAE